MAHIEAQPVSMSGAALPGELAGGSLRYRLLSGKELTALPPMEWLVKGVLPAKGIASVYGASGVGKSFLALDLVAAIAEGVDWFCYRVKQAPVVYVALEGEAGFQARVKAWELSKGRNLPEAMRLVLQPFSLVEPEHVDSLSILIPKGAVVVLDTLNRASPGADENSSRDMGIIIAAAKRLQESIQGVVLLIHHSGKDGSKGMRGHSALPAAVDATIQVSRSGGRRLWKVEKSKDGEDGASHLFDLVTISVGEDDFGDEITSCAVRPDAGRQLILSVTLPQGANQKIALDAIKKILATASPIPDGGQPASYPAGRPAAQLDNCLPVVAAGLDCATDRRTTRAREALQRLVNKGMVVEQDGWLWLP